MVAVEEVAMMRWRSWSPEGTGRSGRERERAIGEVVALLEVDEFEPEDVRVEWRLGDRWLLAPRATFRARARGREARLHRLRGQQRAPSRLGVVRSSKGGEASSDRSRACLVGSHSTATVAMRAGRGDAGVGRCE